MFKVMCVVRLIFILYRRPRNGRAPLIRTNAGRVADSASLNAFSTKAQLYSWVPKKENIKTIIPEIIITRVIIK